MARGEQPTRRQQQVLRFIVGFQVKNQFSPTLAEIARHIGGSSPASATYHVKALERHKLIDRRRGPRAIRILPAGRALLEATARCRPRGRVRGNRQVRGRKARAAAK